MAAKPPKERKVGTVEHYYPKVHAASVGLEGDLKLGDTVHIQGHGDDLRERVSSMQVDHVPIQEGHAGQHIGLQVPRKVHEKAEVFKVEKSAAPKKEKPKAAKAPRKAAKKAKKSARKPQRAARKAPKRVKKKAAKKSKSGKAAKKAGKARRKR
jgi:translation elongation factor EF-1alpha